MDTTAEALEGEIDKAWEEEADCREAELQSGAALEVPGPQALARLRARGQLAEFRVDDLRFTSIEITRLCNDLLNLNLTDANLALMQQRTEGWVAGVRLLTLAP